MLSGYNLNSWPYAYITTPQLTGTASAHFMWITSRFDVPVSVCNIWNSAHGRVGQVVTHHIREYNIRCYRHFSGVEVHVHCSIAGLP